MPGTSLAPAPASGAVAFHGPARRGHLPWTMQLEESKQGLAPAVQLWVQCFEAMPVSQSRKTAFWDATHRPPQGRARCRGHVLPPACRALRSGGCAALQLGLLQPLPSAPSSPDGLCPTWPVRVGGPAQSQPAQQRATDHQGPASTALADLRHRNG